MSAQWSAQSLIQPPWPVQSAPILCLPLKFCHPLQILCPLVLHKLLVLLAVLHQLLVLLAPLHQLLVLLAVLHQLLVLLAVLLVLPAAPLH